MAASYPAQLTLAPAAHAQGTVALPGSKSISNRALLLAALAQGTTTLVDLLEADDTKVMLDALRALGIVWRDEGGRRAEPGCTSSTAHTRTSVIVLTCPGARAWRPPCAGARR